MKRIGIIGSGSIGAAIARLAVAAQYEVMIANSRGPESLTDLIGELGPLAQAGTASEATEFCDITVVSVPLVAYPDLPIEQLAGKVVLSTGNYYPGRDSRIATLDNLEVTTAQYEQALLPGAQIVKAFNSIVAHHIPLLAGSEPRTALPIAGDNAQAKQAVAQLVEVLGFDTVDAGSLAESWSFEPESGAYTSIYAASQEGFRSAYLSDTGAPVTADELRGLLAKSERADVAARLY